MTTAHYKEGEHAAIPLATIARPLDVAARVNSLDIILPQHPTTEHKHNIQTGLGSDMAWEEESGGACCTYTLK